jgi:hypothetical protein
MTFLKKEKAKAREEAGKTNVLVILHIGSNESKFHENKIK